MSQNKNKKNNDERSDYRLKTDAVDRLVNAKNKSYTTTNKDPGRQFRSKGFLDKIPEPIKALFIKFWFSGAVCFFIYWGLGIYIWDTFDMIIILGIVSGMVTDILVNNTFRFLAVVPDINNKWMMFPKKKFWTFFANIIYSLIILVIVVYIYESVNVAGNYIFGTENQIYLGVEPILFGIFYVAVDMLFIGMKNLTIRIFKDAKEKAEINK